MDILWWAGALVLMGICLVVFLILWAINRIAKDADEEEERRSREYFDR